MVEKKIGWEEKYSLAKNIYLPTLTKPVKFGQTLPVTLQLAVVHTALYVHNGAVQ